MSTSPSSKLDLPDLSLRLVAKQYALGAYGAFFLEVIIAWFTTERPRTGMYLYEYAVTFDREVETIWNKKFSFPTILWTVVSYVTNSCFKLTVSP